MGSLFAERYRLVRMASAGANTVIFDADDTVSGRPVTLKIVHPGDGWSRRSSSIVSTVRSVPWRRSRTPTSPPSTTGARRPTGRVSAAYVVIERLVGGSMRDLLDRGRRLTPSQALVIGLDACRALDHAHRRGFVHGELTPSKLVFGDDRRLRIVDFGLASLLGEQQWEEPATVATHVAGYASPEQALSLPIDGKSDVYALCLVMVEAVTGSLPFASDSTVATLSARVGRLMPVSADLGSLAAVLEHAGRPEPGGPLDGGRVRPRSRPGRREAAAARAPSAAVERIVRRPGRATPRTRRIRPVGWCVPARRSTPVCGRTESVRRADRTAPDPPRRARRLVARPGHTSR